MDAYAENLAKANDVREVSASEDILNAQGQIIVKKGTKIDVETAHRITRFKLMRPLEHTVVVENQLNSEILQECFKVYFQSNASLAQMFDRYNDPEQLKQCTDYFDKYPLLSQKVTILSLIMPSVFEQAMFCAWFCLVLSKRILHNSNAHRDLFVAALCHDIGMVHISSEILNKKSKLTNEEWKLIQSHPIIAYNIIKETKGLKPIVGRAVLEHHENLDGTGYPRGCVGAMLCHEGQLLNLLDSINAIYNKQFVPNGRSLREILPIVQMNQHSRFGQAAKHLIVMIRELPQPQVSKVASQLVDELIRCVIDRYQYIATCVEICGEIANELGYREQNPKIASLQNAIIHITLSIAQSGIVNEAYMRWLKQVQSERLIHAYNEVEEAFLMMQEIIYHIDKLCIQLELYLSDSAPNPVTKTLAANLEQLKNTNKPPLSERLASTWRA